MEGKDHGPRASKPYTEELGETPGFELDVPPEPVEDVERLEEDRRRWEIIQRRRRKKIKEVASLFGRPVLDDHDDDEEAAHDLLVWQPFKF